MEPDFLPEKLMKTSASLVRMTHKMHGLQRLPPRVALGNSLAALGCMSDTLAVLQTVVASFKYRIRAWVVAALCITLSFALSWWILIGAAVGAFVALRFAKEERDGWMYLAAVLLGMDVLAVNFGGWGDAYPALQKRALEFLNDDPAHPTATSLDFYLPRRANLSPDSVRNFSPDGAV